MGSGVVFRTSRGAHSVPCSALSASMATRAAPELSRSAFYTRFRAANGFDNGSAGSGGLQADEWAKQV
eukprot:15436800-Alexandrium_andersonii.AAC.1